MLPVKVSSARSYLHSDTTGKLGNEHKTQLRMFTTAYKLQESATQAEHGEIGVVAKSQQRAEHHNNVAVVSSPENSILSLPEIWLLLFRRDTEARYSTICKHNPV